MNLLQRTSAYRFLLMVKAYDRWLKKNEKVLDIGCGKGTITKFLIDRYSLHLQACDINNYLIDKKISFKKMVGGKLPKFKQKFDAALLNDVLHHISKDKQASIIKDSLKVASKILIFEMKPTLLAKIFDFLLNKFHYGDLETPLSFRTVSDWKRLFKKFNIKSKLVIINRPFWYPFSHIAFMIEKK